MRSTLLLLPLALMVACEDDKAEDLVEPEANFELPEEIADLYEDIEWSDMGVGVTTTDVDCGDENWFISAYTAGDAVEVWGFWWDLSNSTMGEALELTEDTAGSWSLEVSHADFGHDCDTGTLAYVVLPVDADGVPGDAEIDERMAGDNAITSTGFSLTNDTGSIELITGSEVDLVAVHVVNPYASYYLGPMELDPTGPTSFETEVNVATDLGVLSFDAVWIAYAAVLDGQLVGIAGG